MSEISTKPPGGMRDFLAADVVRRRHVLGVVQRVYESFGFVPLETPAIENLSTLLGKYGPEGDQLLFRILHRRDKLQRALAAGTPGEADLADEGLRYDLTVPLARVVANHRDLPQYYKRYQIQPVWRADRPGKGRFREFWQCDVDITGTGSQVADVEVCSAVAAVLRELGFGEFAIRVNDRRLLRQLVVDAGLTLEQEGAALIAIDKLDKIGPDGVRQELSDRGMGEQGARLLARMQQLEAEAATFGDGLQCLERLARTPTLAALPRGDGPLRSLLEAASAGPAAPHLRFDPTLARGLGYYTGPIFEISVPGLAGSMGGGGRYDGLVGMFQKQRVPAVGFSLGLERVLLVMEERGMFPELAVGPQVLLCRTADVHEPDVIRVATALRKQGLRVEVFADTPPLGKQLAYADRIGARFAAILGPAELAAGTVSLKDLQRGEQMVVPVDDVAVQVGKRT